MISNVYSYYLSQYGNKANTRYVSHKASDLKIASNKLQKINSQSPIYKVDISEDAQKYAIDLKESANELTYIAKELSGSDSDKPRIQFKKLAESSDESSVSVEYIGGNRTPPVNSFEVNVTQLALTQVNTGNYLQPYSKHLDPGEYSFDLNVSELTYEFELTVDKNDTSKSIQDKISRLINRSNIGLKSEVLSDNLGNTAIAIESESTGISNMKPTIFTVENNNLVNPPVSSDTSGNNLVDTIGLNRTSQFPTNAIFSIDGSERISTTNVLTINNAFKLNLNKTTLANPITISLKDDGDAVFNSISQLVDGYNKLISVTAEENNNQFKGNSKLKREFTNISLIFDELLKNNGLDVQDDGSININKESMKEASNNGKILHVFSNLDSFKNAIQNKAENISLNPMNYVNNKIVAYKNPNRSLMDPYNPSAYVGMMFNGFI